MGLVSVFQWFSMVVGRVLMGLVSVFQWFFMVLVSVLVVSFTVFQWFFMVVVGVLMVVPKRENLFKTQKVAKFKFERENGTGGGPMRAIEIDTLALGPSFRIVFCDRSSKCAPAEGQSDR